MKIDERVEPLVRAALDGAVNRDAAKFEAALAAFPDQKAVQHGVELVVAITAFVLFEVHEGWPSPHEIDELASDIHGQEQWAGPTKAELTSFLSAIVEQRPMTESLSQESILVLPYLVAANLLATSSAPEEGEWWFKYLDKVEAAIEAAP